MDPTQPIQREGPPDFATRVLTGAGLGWIALPLLVLAAAAAHGRSGTDWIAPTLAGGIVAGGTGLLIAIMRLGRAGLIGAVGGVLAGAALPYVAIPPLLGLCSLRHWRLRRLPARHGGRGGCRRCRKEHRRPVRSPGRDPAGRDRRGRARHARPLDRLLVRGRGVAGEGRLSTVGLKFPWEAGTVTFQRV